MKKLMNIGRLLMVALMLASSVSLFAQDRAKIASANEMQMLTEKLALDADQVAKLKVINDDADSKLVKIDAQMNSLMDQRKSSADMTPEQRENMSTEMRTMKSQRMEIISAKKEQISAMLNDEQRAKYNEISDKRPAPPAMEKRASDEPAPKK